MAIAPKKMESLGRFQPRSTSEALSWRRAVGEWRRRCRTGGLGTHALVPPLLHPQLRVGSLTRTPRSPSTARPCSCSASTSARTLGRQTPCRRRPLRPCTTEGRRSTSRWRTTTTASLGPAAPAPARPPTRPAASRGPRPVQCRRPSPVRTRRCPVANPNPNRNPNPGPNPNPNPGAHTAVPEPAREYVAAKKLGKSLG